MDKRYHDVCENLGKSTQPLSWRIVQIDGLEYGQSLKCRRGFLSEYNWLWFTHVMDSFLEVICN